MARPQAISNIGASCANWRGLTREEIAMLAKGLATEVRT
jgi:hypothetical protein